MALSPTEPTELVDHLLQTDPQLRRLTQKLHRQQNMLKRAVDAEQFRLYLLLEETVNEWCLGIAQRVWTSARRRIDGQHQAGALAGNE